MAQIEVVRAARARRKRGGAGLKVKQSGRALGSPGSGRAVTAGQAIGGDWSVSAARSAGAPIPSLMRIEYLLNTYGGACGSDALNVVYAFANI
jgi:hypothetical protein